MFSGRPSVSHMVVSFPRYLQYLLTDFRQTFVTGASWDTDDLITFLGQKVKVQGHTIAAETHSNSTLPSSATFYPRDAMLARVFAIATCPSVCPSVRRAPVLCLAERKQDREVYTI